MDLFLNVFYWNSGFKELIPIFPFQTPVHLIK